MPASYFPMARERAGLVRRRVAGRIELIFENDKLTDEKAPAGVGGGWPTHVGILEDQLNGVKPHWR